jgi:cytoskeleton protein RodZ
MTTMNSERADEPMTPNQHDIPGKVLAAHREAMGWTVEQVADQLKLAVRQVVALEAGDYASLPSAAVTRGFVRAYAKLVKVDPAPLVAQIAIESEGPAQANQASVRRPAPASFSQTKFPSHGKRSSLPLGLIAAAVVLVAAAGAAWHFGVIPIGQHGEAPAAPAAAPAGASPEATSGNSTETLQNPAVPLISVPGPNGNAPANAPANGAAPGAAAQPGAAPASPAPVQTRAAAPTLSPATAPAAAAPAAGATTGANALVINVRQDSWVDVRPAKGGAPLISRLVTAGSTETIAVDQPVRVVVGNPGGVTATLRGAAVALPPVPGKTLARVSLQ